MPRITEKYFDYENKGERIREILAEIIKKTAFNPDEQIFRGVIYDASKIGSVIYKGRYQGMPAVLKIQLLNTGADEKKIIDGIKRQNKSTKIGFPEILLHSPWDAKKGYGYTISLLLTGGSIYNPPFATDAEIKEFCEFYADYKTIVKKPLFAADYDINDSYGFVAERVTKWSKIAESRGHITQEIKNLGQKFTDLYREYSAELPLEFMHAHLSTYDIRKQGGHYILMSNLFWDYRPKYYDLTFHLWAALKSIRDTKVTAEQLMRYVEKWFAAYKKMPLLKNDVVFEKTFYLLMGERWTGALIIDLDNQKYEKEEQKNHLKSIFWEMAKNFIRSVQ